MQFSWRHTVGRSKTHKVRAHTIHAHLAQQKPTSLDCVPPLRQSNTWHVFCARGKGTRDRARSLFLLCTGAHSLLPQCTTIAHKFTHTHSHSPKEQSCQSGAEAPLCVHRLVKYSLVLHHVPSLQPRLPVPVPCRRVVGVRAHHPVPPLLHLQPCCFFPSYIHS